MVSSKMRSGHILDIYFKEYRANEIFFLLLIRCRMGGKSQD